MTVSAVLFLSVLTEWFAGQAPHPAGVAVQQIEGTAQALRQSAIPLPSCTFWTGYSALGKSAICCAFGVETALSFHNVYNTWLFFLEIRSNNPLSHASLQETGSSQGWTSQRATGRCRGKA
jgi:hypothetical protein